MSEFERGHRTPRHLTLKILAHKLKRPFSYFLDGMAEDREAEAFLMVGLAYLHAGSCAEAAEWLSRSREAAAADGDETLQARIDLALAPVDQHLGHDLRAWRRAERVLHVLANNSDRQTLIRAQACLDRGKLAAGDAALAAWTFEAALRLLPQPNSSPSATLYYYVDVTHERLGPATEAAEAFHKALDIAERFADPQRAGASHIDLAAAAARDGRFDDAIALAPTTKSTNQKTPGLPVAKETFPRLANKSVAD